MSQIFIWGGRKTQERLQWTGRAGKICCLKSQRFCVKTNSSIAPWNKSSPSWRDLSWIIWDGRGLIQRLQSLKGYLHRALSVRPSLFRSLPACGIDSSTATIPWRFLFPQGLPQGSKPSETDLLQHGLIHSHNPFRNRPAPAWPYPQPQSFQKQTCTNMASPLVQALRGCSCSLMGLSNATFFEVLQHNLLHSHWCYKVHPLQHGSSTTTDASKCIFSCMDLSLDHNPFRGTPAATDISMDAECLIHRDGLFNSSSHWSSSLSRKAAQDQKWHLGHLPAQAHHHCCYQNVPRHGTTARTQSKTGH